MRKKNILIRFLSYLWSLFLNGLFTILPITLTIIIFNASFKLIIGWFEPLQAYIKPTILGTIPYAEVVLIIVSIFLIGTIMKILVLRTIIHAIEGLFFKIPLIRPVYSGIKQLVQAFSIQDKITFQNVVVVEFPRKGIYSLGFMTSELPTEIAPQNGENFYNIFIPTTPNPTSGYFVMISQESVRTIDLTRQEAMAMIISGGIIQPERFGHKKSEQTD